jgi:hypothetical protein
VRLRDPLPAKSASFATDDHSRWLVPAILVVVAAIALTVLVLVLSLGSDEGGDGPPAPVSSAAPGHPGGPVR